MKNLFTYLKALLGAWGNLQSKDVRHDRRRSDLRRSPSGLDAKWKQNPFMRFAVVLTLIFTIGIGNVWGAEEVIYTLTPYNTGTDATSTGYGNATDASCEDEDADITITWNVTGNTNMVPWRIGGKGGKGTTSTYDRVIYSKNAISNNVTKIVITHRAASGITVNSMTVVVSTAQNGGGTVTSTLTPTFAANGDVTINRPAGKDWSGKYYKINYNVSITGDKNKFLEFSQAEFYADVSSCEKIGAPTVTATPGDRQIVLEWPKQAEASSYTVTCPGGTVGTITGTTTKSCTITSLTNGTSYTWTVTPVGDGSIYCADGNTAASASATPNVYYTVTWMNNGSSYTTTSVESGQKPTFPDNPSSCDGTSTTFVGWTPTPWSGKLDDVSAKTIYTSGSAMPDVSGPVTYHAVFAKASGSGSGSFELNKDDFGSSYSSEESTLTKLSTNDIGYKQCRKNQTNNTPSGWCANGLIEIRGSNSGHGEIYNKTAISGLTTLRVYEVSGASNLTVYYGTSSKTTENSVSSPFASVTGTESVSYSRYSGSCSTSTITLNYYDVSIPSGNDYFYIYASSGTNIFKITVSYSSVSYSQYLTTCCTQLGTINGSVSWSNAATAVVSWDNIDHVSSWTVKYKTHAAGAYTTWAGEQTVYTKSTTNDSRKVTITGLTPCTDYDFQIIANPASGYCEKDQTIEDSQTHNWTVTKTGVTNVTAASLSAIPATTCNGFGPITITAATGYALPADITVTNATKSWNSSTGALSISSVTGNVSITITPTCVSPVITADPADASYYVGDAPTALSVTATLASGTLTYLWKVSTNGGSTWSDATGTNNTFSYSGASLSTASAGTLKFKCIVGNSEGGCSVESGVATITVSNASYFPNGKTIFIQAHSTSAWSDANYDCVKAWFHTAGGSETAQTTYWLFDATGGDSGKKLFAAIVPATGDLPYLDIQRFTHDCSDWRNKNGGCSYSDANGSNTIRSTGNTDTHDAQDDYIRWNATGVTMNLMSSDAWLTPVASMTDQGSGVWSGTYEYTPSNTSTEYVIATNYNGNIGNTGSNNNATLSGMVVGSTYDVTATLDIKDHSLEMSKTFVKGTVHFNLQGHGLAISDLTNVTAGSKISAPSPAPTDAAYDFGGWYKEPACTNAWNFASDVVNETMTLYAKWTPHNFTITYEGLAGASNANPTSYTIETATIVLANPGSRTGYTFTGWTLGGSPITQIVLGTTGDKTITATWSINTPNLAVSAADHVVITATPASESAIAEGANRNVNYNKTVTLNCTPDEHWNLVWDVYKTGESSTKVALSGSGDGATFTMPDYAVTVSAVMTEAAYKTVCFKNNGEDIDGYASVKVYVGESPVAPTLTDGTSGDACDPTSDKHYGWTKETWTSTIATQSEIDERTGSEAVYAKSAALPVVAAEDPSVITYHAVWAAGSGSPAINSTLIAKWDKQALTASTAVKAKDKDGNTLNDVTMTSSFNLATEGTYCYQNTITSTVTITISGLDFSAYDKGALSFYARGSQTRTIDVDYSTGGAYSDLVTTPKITKKEQAYEISNIPKATTSIKLTYVYGTSGETFYFGTVRAYGVNNTPSYEFTELTDDNTSGWTGSDWDGYYIITGNSSTKALRSSGICGFSDFATVSAVDSKISTSDIGLIFRINYSSENSGFVVQGLGGGDYMATEKVNSDAFSIMTTTVAYLYGMSYNSLAHTSSTYLKWSTDRFGIYSSSTGVNPTLYKMLGAAENFLTTCCTQYDISGASTSGTAVTGGTLTSTDNSACEDREVKITANVSDGYRFDSWTITAGGSPVARKDGSAEIEDGNPIYVFDMPAADVTVSAAFTRVYPVTYDANGGTGEMIDVNSPYAAGDKVTVLANTFTKAGYNFDSWSYSPAVSVTDGKFDMPSSDVTITAQWTAKPLNNIILAQTEAEIYDQQYVQIDVTYDPSDIVTKGYTLTGPALTKVVTTGSTQTQLKISATKAGVIISEVVSETVSIKANADETKTASVVVTIKPLPRVHFTDIIHNVVFGDVVEEIVGNVLSGAKTTPTHSDISDPGASYNTCERQHLHLLGWIESTWADAHPGATSWEITDAGSGIYYEAGASINVEVQNGKTFYAVWCIVE